LSSSPFWPFSILLAFAGDDERPNLVLILARDLTRGHLECYGGKHSSPNIDRLAKEGVRYETAWRMPDENLSKKTLFSGRYPSHHEKAPALSALLEQSGYQSGGMNTDLEKSLSFLAQVPGKSAIFHDSFCWK
jgi:arylsulfatase A-like enzyme